jgi:hypothetical protein
VAQYPQDAATAGASDTTVTSGEDVTIGGEGWNPGSTVALRLPSFDLGLVPVDEQGQFSTTLTIPADVSKGEQFITVSGTSLGGEPSEIGIRLLVAGPVGAPREDVDYSGSNIILWAGIALGLFLVGAGAVGRVRRRATPPNTPPEIDDHTT